MEKRRLKQKKEDLMEVQRRVVAYARRKKNPLYVLGDGFLTLVAAFYIFIEEAVRFVRYRLSFEAFMRFLKEDVRWYRVWIHLILAFILPVVVFSLSITSQSGSFWSNFFDKLSQGVLFSTTVSLAATLMTDFIETMKPIQAEKESNEKKETGVYTITIDQAKIGGLMVTIVILMISSFLFTQAGKASINFFGLVLQFALYGACLLLYGAGGQFQGQEKVAEEASEKGDQESHDL